jgi:hypothetical protein
MVICLVFINLFIYAVTRRMCIVTPPLHFFWLYVFLMRTLFGLIDGLNRAGQLRYIYIYIHTYLEVGGEAGGLKMN